MAQISHVGPWSQSTAAGVIYHCVPRLSECPGPCLRQVTRSGSDERIGNTNCEWHYHCFILMIQVIIADFAVHIFNDPKKKKKKKATSWDIYKNNIKTTPNDRKKRHAYSWSPIHGLGDPAAREGPKAHAMRCASNFGPLNGCFMSGWLSKLINPALNSQTLWFTVRTRFFKHMPSMFSAEHGQLF